MRKSTFVQSILAAILKRAAILNLEQIEIEISTLEIMIIETKIIKIDQVQLNMIYFVV